MLLANYSGAPFIFCDYNVHLSGGRLQCDIDKQLSLAAGSDCRFLSLNQSSPDVTQLLV